MHDRVDDDYSNKAEACEAADDVPVNPDVERSIGAVIARRYSRRDTLKGALGVTAATALFGAAALGAGRAAAQTPDPRGPLSAPASQCGILRACCRHRHVTPRRGLSAEVMLRGATRCFRMKPSIRARYLSSRRPLWLQHDYVASSARSDAVRLLFVNTIRHPDVMSRNQSGCGVTIVEASRRARSMSRWPPRRHLFEIARGAIGARRRDAIERRTRARADDSDGPLPDIHASRESRSDRGVAVLSTIAPVCYPVGPT